MVIKWVDNLSENNTSKRQDINVTKEIVSLPRFPIALIILTNNVTVFYMQNQHKGFHFQNIDCKHCRISS